MKHLITAVVATVLLSACASGPSVSLSVTNRPAAQDTTVSQVDVFRTAEKVHAVASVAGDFEAPVKLQAVWFNGDTKRATSKVASLNSAGVVSFIVPASTLGEGMCRVDVYLDEAKAGSQRFSVGGN